jgi:DNA-binding transcriptional LysR family regulator
MTAREALLPDALAAFSVFARHLNLTRAAEELHIAQPSLHAKVQKLATSLGEPLYERIGRRLQLTSAGEDLAALANDVESRVDDYLAGRTEDVGHVVIAAGRAALMWVLDAPIRELLGVGIQPELVPVERARCLEMIRSGTADVGCFAFDPPPDDLHSAVIASYPQTLIVPKGHPLSRRRRVSVGDLDGIALVVPPTGRPHRQSIERTLAQASVGWSAAATADGWDLTRHLVSLGVGAAVVNGCVPPLAPSVAIPIADLPEIPYWLVWRAARGRRAELLLERATPR